MAVRSIIEIDVDDGRFKAFQALYERYETALAKAPGKWAEINKQIDTGGKTFQALTAAILAQTETLSNIITQQKGVTYEVENAIVFFIAVSATLNRAERKPMLESACGLWSAQLSSLNASAFAASLPRSTGTGSSGETSHAHAQTIAPHADAHGVGRRSSVPH